MEELIDVLDENGVNTGKAVTRSEIHKKGLWHRVIVVAIINDKNEILMQQRSFNKDKNAGMWDISVAGHISAGQSSALAAKREIKEEVNVDIEENELEYQLTYKSEQIINKDYIDNQFYDFYIIKKDGLRIEDITVQKSEVETAMFVDINKLNKMVEEKQVVERNIVYETLNNYLFKIK